MCGGAFSAEGPAGLGPPLIQLAKPSYHNNVKGPYRSCIIVASFLNSRVGFEPPPSRLHPIETHRKGKKFP